MFFALTLSLMYLASFGIAVDCVNDVRNTYGLPCCVMFAASPPVKFGISARFVSAMLTMNEPENTGPITTYAPWSTAFCASALATPGFDWVSSDVYSILRPRMPPASLISFTASLTPLSKLVPAVAPVPESSISPNIGTGPCCASDVVAADIISAAIASRLNRFIVPPQDKVVSEWLRQGLQHSRCHSRTDAS